MRVLGWCAIGVFSWLVFCFVLGFCAVVVGYATGVLA